MKIAIIKETPKKVREWQKKLDEAKSAYDGVLSELKSFQAYYDGTREIARSANAKRVSTKQASNVRNIVYELIESQVDSSVPMPRVYPIHEEDAELARLIEYALMNEIKLLRLSVLNDQSERTTPIKGGDFYRVDWDNNAGLHCTVGDLAVSEVDPKCVLPQPGVTDLDKQDYIFVRTPMTKAEVKRKYHVDVEDAKEEDTEIRDKDENEKTTTNIVTVNTAYYKNDDGGVGVFTWCDSYILEDMEDYQSRILERCTKCGAVRVGDECPECGGRSFKKSKEELEEITEDITIFNNEIVPQYTPDGEEFLLDEDGSGIMGEDGIPLMTQKFKKTTIPYYNPRCYPLVLRRNVSNAGRFLGRSDVDVIKDQQEAIKKLGTKIEEKLLKGGSFVTLPKGVGFSTSDDEFKIARVDNAQQKSLIGVVTVQADISKDIAMLEQNNQWARDTIGITDSYQGKYDSSATSGLAKQYSINQAAGRLESKRVQKNAAYSKLYELMFKFWLAYADQDIPVSYSNPDGTTNFSHFNRYQFLKRDAAGELYWNDEFVFDIDPTSTLMANREAMWQQTDLKLQSGAFGPQNDLRSLQMYWSFMEKNGYPNAGNVKREIDKRIQEEQAMQQQLQGGGENVMSNLQNPNGNII